MAEIKSQGEPTFPIKRKPDLHIQDSEVYPNKPRKLETLETDNQLTDGNNNPQEYESVPKANCTSQTPNEDSCSLPEDKNIDQGVSCLVSEANNQDHHFHNDGVGDDEGLNDLDRKGKGVRRDDKGKGKMIVEEDEDGDDDDSDDSDDDSSDDGEISEAYSDLSDDPLAEVDLENILPSRTRRRTFHPGVYIANDLGNDDGDDDDGESDDGND